MEVRELSRVSDAYIRHYQIGKSVETVLQSSQPDFDILSWMTSKGSIALSCFLRPSSASPSHSISYNMHLAQDTTQANGATDYGKSVVNGLKREEKLEQGAVRRLSDEQDHVLKSFRLLIADLCQQFNGGHPG